MTTPYGTLLCGEVLDTLRTLPDESVNCCITSPPYWGLRDYGHDNQLGLERTPEEYVSRMVEIFREVRRVLRRDGTLWLNLGDSYGAGTRKTQVGQTVGGLRGVPENGRCAGYAKQLVGIPWRVAFALQADGWYLRQDIIWAKPNPMPESVTDRCTKAHEYVFLMSKSSRYYYDNDAVKEPANYDGRKDTFYKGSTKYPNGYSPTNTNTQTMAIRGRQRWKVNKDGVMVRNKRSVWTVTIKPYKEAHFATFPRELIRPMIQAGCPADGVVLDPFMGSGTTAIEAIYQGKRYIGIDLNPDYCQMAQRRIDAELEQMTIKEVVR